MSKRAPPPRHAYLLRCWQEKISAFGAENQWRFSVEEVLHKRRRRGFTSVETLFDFLKAELERNKDATLQNNQDNVPYDTET